MSFMLQANKGQNIDSKDFNVCNEEEVEGHGKGSESAERTWVGDSSEGECARRQRTPIVFHYIDPVECAARHDSTLADPSSPSPINLAAKRRPVFL